MKTEELLGMVQHGGRSQLIPGDHSGGSGVGGGGGGGGGVERTSSMSNLPPDSEKLNLCWLFTLKGCNSEFTRVMSNVEDVINDGANM